MSAPLLEIIYCSRETSPLGCAFDPEFAAILNAARPRNERLGITGAMLFNSGYFAQLLEGPSEAVERVFTSIRADARHHEVVVVSRRPIADRSYPHWAMGFTETQAQPAIAATLARAIVSPGDEIADEIRAMLHQSIATARVWGTDVSASEIARG